MQQKKVTYSEANTTFTTLPPNESLNLPTCTLYRFKVPVAYIDPNRDLVLLHRVKFSQNFLMMLGQARGWISVMRGQAKGWISVMLGQQGVGSVSRVLNSRIFSPGGNSCGNKLTPPHQDRTLLMKLCFSHLWSCHKRRFQLQ